MGVITLMIVAILECIVTIGGPRHGNRQPFLRICRDCNAAGGMRPLIVFQVGRESLEEI